MMTLHQTVLAQETVSQKAQEEKKMVIAPGSLTATIKDSVTFSILTKALAAAELDGTLVSCKILFDG